MNSWPRVRVPRQLRQIVCRRVTNPQAVGRRIRDPDTEEIGTAQGADCHGLRRRKNCALFVAGRITDLLVPSSVTLAVFVTQLAGAASVPAWLHLQGNFGNVKANS